MAKETHYRKGAPIGGLFARFIEDKSALATARAEYDIYKDIPAVCVQLVVAGLVTMIFRV